MSDRYLAFVNTPAGKAVAGRLGLPRPSVLRRHRPGAPLVPGPVLVPADASSTTDADAVAEALLAADLDVRRQPGEQDRFGAVVVVLTGLARPGDLGDPMLTVGGVLRRLTRGGRVVTITRPATGTTDPVLASARRGVEGIVRSLAKESRGGSTANVITVADQVPVTAPSALGALRFFLSGRSAFVHGQVLAIGDDAGTAPTDPERPLTDQVAVVTGAARGIGAQIARTLAAQGARVVAVDIPAAGDALAKVANAVQGTALQLDVTAYDAAERIIEHARTRYGHLDVMVHNAGITRDKLLANMTRDRWDSVLAVNLEAPLRITEQLLASDVLGPAPRIIGVSSTSGLAGNRGQTNYGASKAGVAAMVAAWTGAVAERGGTINAVAPGFIETDMTAKIPPVTRQLARRLSSMQQGGQPVDVAETIAFLASPQAGGITGVTQRVCGQNLVGA